MRTAYYIYACILIIVLYIIINIIYKENFEIYSGNYRYYYPLDNDKKAEIVYMYRADGKYDKISLGFAKDLTMEKRACKTEIYGNNRVGINHDFTDVSVRALLLGKNKTVSLSSGHLFPNSMSNKFSKLVKNCNYIWKSEFDKKWENFKFNQWNSSQYTKDGINIISIVQHDWHAGIAYKNELKKCNTNECNLCKNNDFNCWWLGLTIKKSIDEGITYQDVKNYKLAIPDTNNISKLSFNDQLSKFYTVINTKPNGGPAGYYQTTNIIKALDSNYYFVTRFRQQPDSIYGEQTGARFILCRALNNSNLDDGNSWNGYNGIDFTNNLKTNNGGEAPTAFKKFSEIRHLSYNTHFKTYIIFGFASDNGVKKLAYMKSIENDIINWNVNSLTFLLPAKYQIDNYWYEFRYPTLIDHNYSKLVKAFFKNNKEEINERRNFDFTGENPYIYSTMRKTLSEDSRNNNELSVVRFQIKF